MKQNWNNFLKTVDASLTEQGHIEFAAPAATANSIFALPEFAVLTVSGEDATSFLQGQVTCDIKRISPSQGGFGAFCTAQGRTACTFFICKNNNDYLLIIAQALLDKISKRLQLYILRADVQLHTDQDLYCVLGLNITELNTADHFELPTKKYAVIEHDGSHCLNLAPSSTRFMLLSPVAKAIPLWQQLSENQGFVAGSSKNWDKLDIVAGIAWLNQTSSEQYIPQMLNLDKLGAISFNKGCYTGQEIIARTHYKGKNKRQMYLAETGVIEALAVDTELIDNVEGQDVVIGKVIAVWQDEQHSKMLVVVQIANAESKNIHLDTPGQDKITLVEFSY